MTKSIRLEKGLLKIGEIAKEAQVPVSSIRYYTDMGLLKAMQYTDSGYRLYEKDETLEIIRMIMIAKSSKPSLNEIKSNFEKMG